MDIFGSNFSIETLDMMHSLGLYINDLSMHDSSRDLVLAGTQQSAELRLALDQVIKNNNIKIMVDSLDLRITGRGVSGDMPSGYEGQSLNSTLWSGTCWALESLCKGALSS